MFLRSIINVIIQSYTFGDKLSLKNDTKKSQKFAQSYLRFHLDAPQQRLVNVVGNSSTVSGWAVDLVNKLAVNVRIVAGHKIYNTTPKRREDVRAEFDRIAELPISTGFTCSLKLPVGVHRVRVEVQGTDGWWFTVSELVLLSIPGKWLKHSIRFVKYMSIHTIREKYNSFLLGETNYSKILTRGYLRFHLDAPRIRPVTIVKDTCVVTGWAVNIIYMLAVNVRIVVGKKVYVTTARQRGDVKKEFSHIGELPLTTGFYCQIKLPVGVHRMRIEVQGIAQSWLTVRKSLLLCIPGKMSLQSRRPKLSYREWVSVEQIRLDRELPIICKNIDAMAVKPAFTVIVDTRQGRPGLNDTIQSIQKQIYTNWDLRIIAAKNGHPLVNDGNILTDMSLSDIRGDFIIFMQCGQCLAIDALYEFSSAINQNLDMDLIYGNEDSFNSWGGRIHPFHKPGWSPDYLETFNYIGFTACFRKSISVGCFSNIDLYHLVLEFTERTTKIQHIAKILGHNDKRRWFAKMESTKKVSNNIAALSNRLLRTGRLGVVSENALHKGCYDIRLELRHRPLVSIVIPTAGNTVTIGGRNIDLIVNIVGQIHNISSYKNIEIIIVDNGNLSLDQLKFLTASHCRLITYTNAVFNIAQKLNLGVSIAKGEFLLLMNDDIEILTTSWIERLLEHFEKKHVGVVGAKLVYPNMETQHVGVVQPFGNPDHVRRNFARNEAGYFFSTCGVRNYSAVTGAVMMVNAQVYREVGGYTDELAVCFNDVDFCMKVGRRGLSVVYAPNAELIHMESLSRVVELDMSELAWFHKRWDTQLVKDQFYNEQFLTVEPPTFVPCVN